MNQDQQNEPPSSDKTLGHGDHWHALGLRPVQVLDGSDGHLLDVEVLPDKLQTGHRLPLYVFPTALKDGYVPCEDDRLLGTACLQGIWKRIAAEKDVRLWKEAGGEDAERRKHDLSP